MAPPVIYLDTQDYSRFGDVLRGKADAATEALFLELERRKQGGDAIFAVSMPNLGELLQYDIGFRKTTVRKAEAVERLCGSWALAFPSRLIAAEIGVAARQRGLLPDGPPIEIVSSDRYWYPDIADMFQNLRSQIRAGIAPEIEALGLPSRKLRRGAKKFAAKMDVAVAARDAAPQMAAEYGLPVEVFTRSIVALLRGTVTPAQASRQLFSAIAQPVKFVEIYFEKVESERTLPAWISGFGRDFEGQLATIRDALNPADDAAPYKPSPTQVIVVPVGAERGAAQLPFSIVVGAWATRGDPVRQTSIDRGLAGSPRTAPTDVRSCAVCFAAPPVTRSARRFALRHFAVLQTADPGSAAEHLHGRGTAGERRAGSTDEPEKQHHRHSLRQELTP